MANWHPQTRAKTKSRQKPSRSTTRQKAGGTDEKLAGKIIRYFERVGAAGVELSDTLEVGDTIRIRGRTTDFTQRAESIELNRRPVNQAHAGTQVGLLVNQPAQAGDIVYRVLGER
jgi:hypothetical protein